VFCWNGLACAKGYNLTKTVTVPGARSTLAFWRLRPAHGGREISVKAEAANPPPDREQRAMERLDGVSAPLPDTAGKPTAGGWRSL
jgi:hypothetical protein